MAELEYKLVDVFTGTAFAGNVAGVVRGGEGLSDKQMLLVTRELGAAATAFILPAKSKAADAGVRWFSSGGELTFCGHGTLGVAHVLFTETEADALTLECKAGIVQVARSQTKSGSCFWLDMPHCEPKGGPVFLPPWLERLGLTMNDVDSRIPAIRTQDDDVIFAVRELQTLLSMNPNSAELGRASKREQIRGFLVTTTNVLSPATVTQSRFFAPACGIEEDPVTGSVHGPLGLHLVKSGIVPLAEGRAGFLCAQAKPGSRAGVVQVEVTAREGGAHLVRIGGGCLTTASGVVLRLPARD